MVLKKTKPENKIKLKERKLFRSFAIFLIVFCIFIGGICYWFYGKINETIRDESRGYLNEIVTRIETNISRIINDTYSMLHSVNKILVEKDNIAFEDFADISDYQQAYWKFENLLLIDENGNAYDTKGNSIFMSGGTFLQEALVNKTATMSPLQMVDGKECSIFSVPIQLTVDGKEMMTLAATFDIETFSQVLSMSSFSNQAYSNIISRDGTIIISSDSESKAEFGYNILSSIDSSRSLEATQMEQLRNNIHSGQKGQFEFSFNGREEYMVFCPISSTNWMLTTFVPMQVINAKSSLLLSITLLISGFIVLSFTLLVVALLITFHRYQKHLEQIAYVDHITGGNTIERFYELAASTLELHQKSKFALVYTNLSKFKILNEKFGREVGDDILKKFYLLIESAIEPHEVLGRLIADNFCILVEYETTKEIVERINQWTQLAQNYVQENKPIWSLPMAEFGIFLVDDPSLPFTQMIDRAKLALRETSGSVNSKVHYAIYNDSVRSLLYREKQLEDMMEEALAKREFKMYLQPKYSVPNETIVGAEALARWASSTEGMIYPNEFIPLFEKNGFVIQLDLFIFEEVCKLVRFWIDKGLKPLRISLNCSRVHLRNDDFLNPYLALKKQYQIPDNCIEIELTESIVLEDAERFKHVVTQIHEAGFGCSMDDFGSGYSSLNMIHEISVDTLKIDKVFFANEESNSYRTESVVSNIIGMANALEMKTVAEGVESEEQIKMLRRVGCDFIQGYVYAKPMPVDEFEKRWESERLR